MTSRDPRVQLGGHGALDPTHRDRDQDGRRDRLLSGRRGLRFLRRDVRCDPWEARLDGTTISPTGVASRSPLGYGNSRGARCSGKDPFMSVRINDVAPNFTADSTQGRITFHDWIGDSYAILFSHP